MTGVTERSSLFLEILSSCVELLWLRKVFEVAGLRARWKKGSPWLLHMLGRGGFAFRHFILMSHLSFSYFKDFSCLLFRRWHTNKFEFGEWEGFAFFGVLTVQTEGSVLSLSSSGFRVLLQWVRPHTSLGPELNWQWHILYLSVKTRHQWSFP